jgi:hypothetical protein
VLGCLAGAMSVCLSPEAFGASYER